ncbi:MAG: trypsin-like peptidase domain-containing protein [Sandaracinus sp.]
MISPLRPLLLAALAALALSAPSAVSAQEMSDRAIDRCTRAAVRIQVDVAGGSSVGSGSIIDAHGYVLTNFHVVGNVRHGSHGGPGSFYDAEHVQIATVSSARDAATTRYLGRVVRGDVRLDLALIRIVANADGTPLAAGTTFPTVPMADTEALQPGSSLWAFGFPMGVRTINVTGGHMTGFQMGGASGTDTPLVSWIRTDAEFNPGNSGGMLVDRQGRLVAVPTAVVSSGDTLEPIELARPVERIPSEWSHALAHAPIDDQIVTGITALTAGIDLVDHAVGDTGGMDGAEVFYYRVPDERPAMVTATPSLPVGLIGPSGDIGREGRGGVQIYPQDPTGLTLAVLVPRSEDGAPVEFTLHFEQTTAPPPPSVAGYPPVPPGYGYGPRGPYPPRYGGRTPPPTAVAGPPVSVHGRVIDASTGAAVPSATVMVARPGVDLASTLSLVQVGRLSQAQLQTYLVATAQTDAEGYYTLANVPRGRFGGAAVIPGYAPAMITLSIGPSEPALIEALPIQLSH